MTAPTLNRDKRGTRDRLCETCYTPITRWSTSGLCTLCVRKIKPKAIYECSRCGDSITRKSTSGMCVRCSQHDAASRNRHATKPTDAQRAAWGMARVRLSTLKTTSTSVCADSPTGAHHYLIESPSAETHGSYQGVCKYCRREKVHTPFAMEDEKR